MDLVRILENVSDDEEVIRLAISEWFLGKPRAAAEQDQKIFTVNLKSQQGGELKIPKLTTTGEKAIQWAENWADNHARFGSMGPWRGTVVNVEAN